MFQHGVLRKSSREKAEQQIAQLEAGSARPPVHSGDLVSENGASISIHGPCALRYVNECKRHIYIYYRINIYYMYMICLNASFIITININTQRSRQTFLVIWNCSNAMLQHEFNCSQTTTSPSACATGTSELPPTRERWGTKKTNETSSAESFRTESNDVFICFP